MIETKKTTRPDGTACSAQAPAKTSDAETDLRRLDSAALFAGRREVTIDHGGEIYRLRLTSNNRLILIK